MKSFHFSSSSVNFCETENSFFWKKWWFSVKMVIIIVFLTTFPHCILWRFFEKFRQIDFSEYIHCLRKSTKKRDHAKKIREINYVVISLSKTLIWRKKDYFCVKIVIVFYSIFPHCGISSYHCTCYDLLLFSQKKFRLRVHWLPLCTSSLFIQILLQIAPTK